MPASDPLLSIKNLVKTYKLGDMEVRALRNVSLEVERSAFVAIMGPSGSGKSTFMNILGCLDYPTSGEYYLDGVDVFSLNRNELAELRNKKIGFIFQSFNVLARTSALDNVELPMLYSAGVSTKERRERAMSALKMVGLASYAQSVVRRAAAACCHCSLIGK